MSNTDFLPWYREGLAALASPAPLGDRGRVRMEVPLLAGGVHDAIAAAALDLMGAGDVAGLSDGLVAERAPTPGSVDAAPGSLCWLALHDAGLPWALPTADDRAGAPAPWLALLCLPEADAVLDANARPLPVLQLGSGGANYLPEPELLPLLAHAEQRGTGPPMLSRLIAPTRLQAGVAYLAALVPARAAGVLAGMGQIAGDASGWAWGSGPETEALPVYAHWRFRCGTVPRFEDVVARLAPAPDAGLRPPDARMTETSLDYLDLLAHAPVDIPLRAPFGAVAPPPEPAAAVSDALAREIETAPGRANTLALPTYGRHQDAPGGSVWSEDVSTTPSLRLGAGLGARLARRHADALADFASHTVGEVDRANAMLSRARAALAARRALNDQLTHLLTGNRTAEALILLAPGRRRIRPGGVPLADTLPNWASGLTDPALRRALTGANARAAGGIPRGGPPGRAPSLSHLQGQARDAAGEPRVSSGRALLTPLPPDAARVETVPDFGDRTTDPAEMLNLMREQVRTAPAPELATARATIDTEARARSRGANRPPPPAASLDLSSVVSEIDPARAISRRVLDRLDLPDRAPDDLGPIVWEPPWPVPLIDLLAREDPTLVAPAAASLPRDGVVLLSLDAPFIEAMLAGANHQAVSDLIWRRFPVRRDMSPVRRVFPRADIEGLKAPPFDVEPLRAWQSGLGFNLAVQGSEVAAAPKTVVLMRTPLFELFPDMLCYAAPALDDPSQDDVPDMSRREGPVAFGRLRSGLVYLGFPRDPSEMAGDPGWFLVFQGPDIAGGFALAADGGTSPSWAEIGGGEGDAARLSLDAPAMGTNPLAGSDAATVAAMLLERPLTVALHMSRLVPE